MKLIKNSSGKISVSLNKNEWLEILESGFTHDKVALTGVILKNEEHTGIPFLIFFCVMIRRDMFDVLGKLDEAFSPGFGEDVDFCARAMKMGYDIVQVPLGKPIELNADNKYVCSFPIYHEGTKTFGEDPTYQTVIQRNIQLLIRKHFKIE